jgi:hypothetical protein
MIAPCRASPASVAKKRMAVRGLSQRDRDRAKHENENEQRRAEPDQTLAKIFRRPMTRDCALRERAGLMRAAANSG